MRRVLLAMMILGLAIGVAIMPVQAAGIMPLSPEEWAGGNGWCEDGVCFRAWSLPGVVEVRWLVGEAAPPLTVIRRQLQPSLGVPAPVAQSDCPDGVCPSEFVLVDWAVDPGAIYQYQLVWGEEMYPLGEPLEAGVAATAADPGGVSGGHRVYLPIALSQRP